MVCQIELSVLLCSLQTQQDAHWLAFVLPCRVSPTFHPTSLSDWGYLPKMLSLLRHSLRLSITQTITSRPVAFATSSAPTTTSALHVRAYASKAKHRQKGGGGGGGRKNNSIPDAADAESESPSSQTGGGGSSKKRAPIATASLTPSSQQTLTDPAAREEYARADAKMLTSVEWFRREVALLEARTSGRVTPRLLAPVRVSLSVAPSASGSGSGSGSGAQKARLEEVATVGVRDGSTLIVTVFEPQVSVLLVVVRAVSTRPMFSPTPTDRFLRR